jgi:hypothetical protein
MAGYGNLVRRELIADEGITTNALIALGVQASDSPQRWISFQRHGASCQIAIPRSAHCVRVILPRTSNPEPAETETICKG